MRARRSALASLVAAGAVALAACAEDGPTPPGAVRFGQVGSMEVRVVSPLRGAGEPDAGQLEQVIRWESNGRWVLEEAISYRGTSGDERIVKNPREPSFYAAAYAQLNTLVNEGEGGTGLGLFIDSLTQGTEPDECGRTRTRISVEINDDLQDETAFWARCAAGTLATLDPREAEPGASAARLVEVIRLARNGTVGENFVSAYAGSVPFGTLDRGADTPSGVQGPVVFTDEGAFDAFWSSHAPGSEAPDVDFASEMVVAGITGVSREAGDSVEVRRILQVDDGTVVEVWERIPGDFCTPADRTHVPFHVVVSPRTPDPVRFGDVRVETVPCGG